MGSSVKISVSPAPVIAREESCLRRFAVLGGLTRNVRRRHGLSEVGSPQDGNGARTGLTNSPSVRKRRILFLTKSLIPFCKGISVDKRLMTVRLRQIFRDCDKHV